MDGVGTVDGRTRRDSHRTSVILDITKKKGPGKPLTRRDGEKDGGGTVERMAAGRRHGGVT